jgi:hypothetical protein
MSSDLIRQRQAFAATGEFQATQLIAPLLSAPELTPAEKNIRLWKSYLPNDCVTSMIMMGWDYST